MFLSGTLNGSPNPINDSFLSVLPGIFHRFDVSLIVRACYIKPTQLECALRALSVLRGIQSIVWRERGISFVLPRFKLRWIELDGRLWEYNLFGTFTSKENESKALDICSVKEVGKGKTKLELEIAACYSEFSLIVYKNRSLDADIALFRSRLSYPIVVIIMECVFFLSFSTRYSNFC